MKLLIMEFSPALCYFLHLSSKCSTNNKHRDYYSRFALCTFYIVHYSELSADKRWCIIFMFQIEIVT
jgi:hypothetical protein